MERLWEMTGMEMREYEDTGGVLPKVRACALCRRIAQHIALS